MPTFSRWMPPAPEHRPGRTGWLAIGVITAGSLAFVVFTSAGKFVVGAFLLLWAVGAVALRRRVKRMEAERLGEDIGTFARALDRRHEPFDPWVVRAVWDAFRPYVTVRGSHAPLRPTDRISEDLAIDWDDVDLIIEEVAERAGRSLHDIEANPAFGRISTVGDLVRLLSGQPPRAAA